MIDQGVFKNEWTVLCERFRMTGKKAPSQLMMRRYYRYLTARMDTEAFRAACEVVYAEREFFPKPVDFVEAVRGDASAEAMAAWDTVLEMAGDWRQARPSDELTDAGLAALRQVGGVRKLAMMDRNDLDFRRRDFLAAYRSALASTESRAALPPMSEDGRKQLESATDGLELQVLD